MHFAECKNRKLKVYISDFAGNRFWDYYEHFLNKFLCKNFFTLHFKVKCQSKATPPFCSFFRVLGLKTVLLWPNQVLLVGLGA